MIPKKHKIIKNLTDDIILGAEEFAKISENDFQDEINNAIKGWTEKAIDIGKIAVFVPSSLISFDQFFSLPDSDISLLGIGNHRFFLFHSGAVAWILKTMYASRIKRTVDDKSISTTIINKIAGVVAGSGCFAIGCHLAIDAFQPKSIVFPYFGSLVDGTLVDDNIWLLGNSIYCFKISHDIFTFALGEDLERVKKFIKINFMEPVNEGLRDAFLYRNK